MEAQFLTFIWGGQLAFVLKNPGYRMLPAWCLNLTILSFCILYFKHISGSEGCNTFRANWDSQVLWRCHAVWRVEPFQASQGRGYLDSFGAEGVYYLTTLGCRPAPSQAPVLLFQWFLAFSAKLFHFHGYLISWSFHFSVLSPSSQILTPQHWVTDLTQHFTDHRETWCTYDPIAHWRFH